MYNVYYLKKNTKSKTPKVVRTKNGRIMLFSSCVLCDNKKSIFIKEQEANGLLSGFRLSLRQL